MLVARRFVFVHQAKTGGTFVATVLKQLHRDRGEDVPFVVCDLDGYPEGRARWLGPAGRFGRRAPLLELHHRAPDGQVNQHGPVWKVAPWFRSLPVLGCTRNPYDTVVSHYEFRWWAQNPEFLGIDPDQLRRRWPHYPDLSFAEYLDLSHQVIGAGAWEGGDLADRPGQATRAFLGVYANGPDVARSVARGGVPGGDPWALVAPVHFLRTEHLSAELAGYLSEHGYSAAEADRVRHHERIFPPEGGRSDDKRDWRPYYTPELKALVRHRERLLFDLFPEYDE